MVCSLGKECGEALRLVIYDSSSMGLSDNFDRAFHLPEFVTTWTTAMIPLFEFVDVYFFDLHSMSTTFEHDNID